jgi:ATP-dependent Clp protease adaptor protein ClpS
MIAFPRQPSTNASVTPSMSGGSGAPDVVIEPEVKVEESLDIPWKVVVHNDPINLMDYVTKVFMKIFGFTREKAERHMMEVHKAGRSIVWTGAREKAELFVEQLHEYLLIATMEQSE